MSKIGLIGELTKKQTNRFYFSDIPVGTKFIITDEHDDMVNYELTGYFLYVMPQIYNDSGYFTGYIEKDSWKLIGTSEEYFKSLKDYGKK